MKEADLEEQYARFPEIKRSEVQKFIEWIHVQPHISDQFSEGEALHFFYACRYSMEVAKQVLDINLTARTHLDEFFVNLDCERPELRRAMKTISIVPLPGATPEGYRVIVTKLDDLNASNYNFADVMKLLVEPRRKSFPFFCQISASPLLWLSLPRQFYLYIYCEFKVKKQFCTSFGERDG
ncbi:uncharacterized protein LOC111067629 isoform X3 [Drosophila obscura]|uniref:uncharacterized protein LOC111067629 isoform X3 n=1 Tax=Drosophila obscura TaxID=7282 RepID=UPI001BB0FECE|nr:uncharacterized protein LOC111067629 isoform X3 [Drosophila obscura]